MTDVTKGTFDTPFYTEMDGGPDAMQWPDPFPEYAESPYSQAQNASPGWDHVLAAEDERYSRIMGKDKSPLTWVPDVYGRQRTPVPGYGMGLQGEPETNTNRNLMLGAAAIGAAVLGWWWWRGRS